MDDIIKRQLALIKQCYLHASEQARIGTSFNRVLALVCLGWCVETLLKSVIRAYNPSYSPRKDPKWDVAWEEANKALLKTKGVQLQHKLQIKKIQEARNLAQHQATIPSKETMDEALVLARSFIDQTLQDAFAISPVKFVCHFWFKTRSCNATYIKPKVRWKDDSGWRVHWPPALPLNWESIGSSPDTNITGFGTDRAHHAR